MKLLKIFLLKKKIKYFRPVGMDILIEKNPDGTWGGSHKTFKEMLSFKTYEALDTTRKPIKP